MQSKIIESERLILRDIEVKDAQTVFEIWTNPENDKYMCDPVGSVDEVVNICMENESSNIHLKVVLLKGTEEIIGTCCFGPSDKSDEWGFGYSISKYFWNQGFATEIVNAIITYGKKKKIKKYISDCAEENTASARVLEKCGMTLTSRSSFLQPKSKIEYASLVYHLAL